MKLYVVRHGIAVDRADPSLKSDGERWLTEEGKRRTRQVAEGLKALGVEVDAVITSPLVRARETAEIMADVLGVKKPIETDALAPGVNLNALFRLYDELDQPDSVMIVGHEPDLSEIVSTLVWGDDRGDLDFKKAGVALLEIDRLPIEEGGVALRWFIPPKVLCAVKP